MTQNETSREEHDSQASRRSFMKTGALASTGLALGTSGAGPALATDGDGDHLEVDAGDLNLADVTFLQMMAYHHRGALELAELVPDRTDRRELIELSEMAIDHQDEEIDEIETILSDAGIEPGRVLDVDLDDVRGLVSAIPGQPEANEIAYLRTLEGDAFDLRFIELFTYHHGGAIQLSRSVLEEGQSSEVERLANDIIEMQLEEIVQMYQWYLDWVRESNSDARSNS
jgi:uncharacterized protein (DUF305 family)